MFNRLGDFESKQNGAKLEGGGAGSQLSAWSDRSEAYSWYRPFTKRIFVLFISGFTGPSSRTVYIDEHPSSGEWWSCFVGVVVGGEGGGFSFIVREV